MVIYWERCSVCVRHLPTKTCWLHPELNVCAQCCVMCPERSICPNPVWYAELGEAPSLQEERAATPISVGAEHVEVKQPAAPASIATAAGGESAATAATPTRKRLSDEKRKKLEELLKKLSEKG
ncbi:hypothetical protein Pyrfu_1902 [Pyrolobus fumarii 1A]|uniref:Uncharacterized protein n=1 Tax=Pyrolobus fumarii (strain DSM 11204 / 1A) TaxID=694429 RepID=G0ED77_PYRF1|nr:hypothetical protein [Pyrolobus fumarii]AEM39755.1 hypothetical protein Pyrfu_1902 [Pyrolobus fumarii 1A]